MKNNPTRVEGARTFLRSIKIFSLRKLFCKFLESGIEKSMVRAHIVTTAVAQVADAVGLAVFPPSLGLTVEVFPVVGRVATLITLITQWELMRTPPHLRQ